MAKIEYIGDSEEELWTQEPPFFGKPIYPIMFPYLIWWAWFSENTFAWASVIADCWIRAAEITFWPLTLFLKIREAEKAETEESLFNTQDEVETIGYFGSQN